MGTELQTITRLTRLRPMNIMVAIVQTVIWVYLIMDDYVTRHNLRTDSKNTVLRCIGTGKTQSLSWSVLCDV